MKILKWFIITVCSIILFSCYKSNQKTHNKVTENVSDEEIQRLSLEDITEIFKSGWEYRARTIKYLLPYLNIGMSKDEVCKIIGYPEARVDIITYDSKTDTELWTYSIFYNRLLELKFKDGILISKHGG